jgi:hypothetical protein
MAEVAASGRRFKGGHKPKLTPSQIVRACRNGASLRLQFGGRARRTFTLNGLIVETHHAVAAIRGGKLKPARDALFPGMSQTWTARELTAAWSVDDSGPSLAPRLGRRPAGAHACLRQSLTDDASRRLRQKQNRQPDGLRLVCVGPRPSRTPDIAPHLVDAIASRANAALRATSTHPLVPTGPCRPAPYETRLRRRRRHRGRLFLGAVKPVL